LSFQKLGDRSPSFPGAHERDGLADRNTGQESPVHPQVGKPAPHRRRSSTAATCERRCQVTCLQSSDHGPKFPKTLLTPIDSYFGGKILKGATYCDLLRLWCECQLEKKSEGRFSSVKNEIRERGPLTTNWEEGAEKVV
jgi:hypothetical protein